MCDEALPRRNVLPTKLGFAPGSGNALRFWATGRTRGTAPRYQALFRRGIAIASHRAAKPRNTSGRRSRETHQAAKPRNTSGRRSRETHRGGEAAKHIGAAKPRNTSGGEAAKHIGAAKPRNTSGRRSRETHRGGEAAKHIGAAKPRNKSCCARPSRSVDADQPANGK